MLGGMLAGAGAGTSAAQRSAVQGSTAQRRRSAPLGGDTDVLADRHAQRAGDQASNTSEHHVVQLRAAALHAQHQAGHADEAVVRAQHRRAQPGRAAAVVLVLVRQLRACAHHGCFRVAS